MGLNAWEEIINHRYLLFPEFQSVMISGTGKNELYVLFWGQPFTTYLLDIYFCCSSATARDRMAHASFPEEGQCVTPDGEDMVECRIVSR